MMNYNLSVCSKVSVYSSLTLNTLGLGNKNPHAIVFVSPAPAPTDDR